MTCAYNTRGGLLGNVAMATAVLDKSRNFHIKDGGKVDGIHKSKEKSSQSRSKNGKCWINMKKKGEMILDCEKCGKRLTKIWSRDPDL